MTWPLVPTTNRTIDWPKKIADAINYLLKKDRDGSSFSSRIDALEGQSGWANYPHSGTQSLATGTRTKLTINGTGKNESQLPTDTGPLWDTATNTITGRNGDSIVAKVQFVFTPDDAVASNLELEIDIGGSIGVVEDETKPIFRGAGVAHPLSFTFPAYTLDTWEANGGEIYATADGPGVVSDLRIVIIRTSRAR